MVSEHKTVASHTPVHCKACAGKGRQIEMIPDPLEGSYLKPAGDTTDPLMRSYRCPVCEQVEVFKVL